MALAVRDLDTWDRFGQEVRQARHGHDKYHRAQRHGAKVQCTCGQYVKVYQGGSRVCFCGEVLRWAG